MKTRALWAALLVLTASGCLTASDHGLRFLSGEGPEYPAEARAARVEGHVVVRYDVTAEGLVENATVVESEPPGVFDAVALTAVAAWRFAAPTEKGVPQAAPARVSRLEFKLGESEAYAEDHAR